MKLTDAQKYTLEELTGLLMTLNRTYSLGQIREIALLMGLPKVTAQQIDAASKRRQTRSFEYREFIDEVISSSSWRELEKRCGHHFDFKRRHFCGNRLSDYAANRMGLPRPKR